MSSTSGETLAFAESPVQLLNVLEWAHVSGADAVTVVVLPPRDALSRGQLRRMAQLARDEGLTVRWREARGGAATPSRALASLAGPLRRAERLLIGDPFSGYLQLLLSMSGPQEVVVVDDGTATMEFTVRLAAGERLVRWHRAAPRGARAALFGPVSRRAARRLTPAGGRAVHLFSAMSLDVPPGVVVTENTFAWTRARFGPPRVAAGADLVGTSLVETGVVNEGSYRAAVRSLAHRHGAVRYLAHRREKGEKLRRIADEANLEIVRPELPLELVARRGPVGHRVLSFPSTVVHTLPRVLADTTVELAVCDIDEAWFTDRATARAGRFLASVTSSARRAHGLRLLPAPQ